MALTSEDIAAIADGDRDRKLFDGGGLYLLARPNGARYWRLKYRFAGKEKVLALGVYPQISLDAAREAAAAARAQLAAGVDPSGVRAGRRQPEAAAVAVPLPSSPPQNPIHKVAPMKPIHKSSKLLNVCYDIRGPVLDRAKQMEDEGQRIIKLNIGNPAPFGFLAPEEIMQDMARHLPQASGYTDSKGLFAARKAIMHYTQEKLIPAVGVEDIYIGNGVSELIVMSMQALLDAGDEVLLPAPDYPLWTAAVTLSGGTAVHYMCDEQQNWYPDIDDIRRKITPNTRAMVIINPNNPTGAVYPDEVLRELVAVAREYGLILFADEIYDKVLFDGVTHTSIASMAPDLFVVTMNGLSKNYRSAGFRAGWMVVSGDKSMAKDYIEGLNMLASMRLCANAPGQHAIQTALGGSQSIDDLVAPTGRLARQRDLAWRMLNDMPGVSCVKPQGALYMFPKLDRKMYPVEDDQQLILELLNEQRVLLVQGSGFNWHEPDHFRVVFLPNTDDLEEAMGRIGRFLDGYRSRHAIAV